MVFFGAFIGGGDSMCFVCKTMSRAVLCFSVDFQVKNRPGWSSKGGFGLWLFPDESIYKHARTTQLNILNLNQNIERDR
ncbi:hypothetical protein ACO34A_28355 (plasmid) [Rhizobium sp. ACO-34A]|nr:hypothetical protein ACO34A_28355 [Rhizobium sp. ACO-34A]